MSWLCNICKWTGIKNPGDLFHLAQDREKFSEGKRSPTFDNRETSEEEEEVHYVTEDAIIDELKIGCNNTCT